MLFQNVQCQRLQVTTDLLTLISKYHYKPTKCSQGIVELTSTNAKEELCLTEFVLILERCKWLFIYLHLPRKLFGGVELILSGLMDGPGVIFFLVVGQETNK